jgi:hypothetical protein
LANMMRIKAEAVKNRPQTIEGPQSQRDPEAVFWTSGFLEAWDTKAKINHSCSKNCLFFGFAAFGGMAKKPFVY